MRCIQIFGNFLPGIILLKLNFLMEFWFEWFALQISFFLDFLENVQEIKFTGSISHWLPTNASIPQGTKLGPILFLVMINNLSISDPESCVWKYVDDVSLSKGLVRNNNSTIQTSLKTVAPLTG